ncbi:MAG: hypothetical protein L6300_06080 [Syntrophaceae bacterium]|nr:hypothetical protein [Syntrophaceae bacterium]
MPTTLRYPFSIDWRGNPPHMLKPDVPVWYRFLETWKDEIKALYYDCLLGGPYLTQQEEMDPIKKSWRYSTSKRPDAIIETENEVWIVEVSANPGLRALGQCMAYLALWVEDPKIIKPEKAVLIVETLDTDLGAACGRMGVMVFVV